MWVARMLWERGHNVDGWNMKEHFRQRDELDWRTRLGIDRIIEYNRTSAELGYV